MVPVLCFFKLYLCFLLLYNPYSTSRYYGSRFDEVKCLPPLLITAFLLTALSCLSLLQQTAVLDLLLDHFGTATARWRPPGFHHSRLEIREIVSACVLMYGRT